MSIEEAQCCRGQRRILQCSKAKIEEGEASIVDFSRSSFNFEGEREKLITSSARRVDVYSPLSLLFCSIYSIN
jgi:hypothetical protein